MKKVLAVLALLLIVFAIAYRTRLYVRDPLASLTHNGLPEPGVQIFINAHNDVLLEQDNAPRYLLLLKHDQPVGIPAHLTCLHWLVCMTDAETVPLLAIDPTARILSASDRSVSFLDSKGQPSLVSLH
jgi:hypothetical protein